MRDATAPEGPFPHLSGNDMPALAATLPERNPGLDRVGHIIVLFLENRSFDHLYGMFPGADGVDNAGFAAIQVTAAGPAIREASRSHHQPRPFGRGLPKAHLGSIRASPPGLPNGPFRADRYVGLWERTIDPVHRFYQEQEQIDDGKMDKFVAVSGAGALPMGYFDGSSLKLYQLAAEYTLADRFFHAAFGGGFLNHFWLICACTPRFDNAPASLVAQIDPDGKLIRDGAVTPDGYAVNTIDPLSTPHDPKIPDRLRLPLQTMPTIGRTL